MLIICLCFYLVVQVAGLLTLLTTVLVVYAVMFCKCRSLGRFVRSIGLNDMTHSEAEFTLVLVKVSYANYCRLASSTRGLG